MRKAIIALLVLILLATLACSSESNNTAIDSDGDGWSDEHEKNAGTNQHNVDTDGDGYWDPSDSNPLDPSIPVSTSTPPPSSTQAITPTSTPTVVPSPSPTQIATLPPTPKDSDNDGTPDNSDGCPYDPQKTDPGQCGCGNSDIDSDGDGLANCNDDCPNDPNKTQPGICGCGIPDIDSDSDGVLDCKDGCPNDFKKTEPGICGCGVADIDSDGDGTVDCNDGCPNDPNKTQPGQCGCNNLDTDSDNDGTADCNDPTPNPPLNVRLDYVGVINAQDDGAEGDVRILMVITDGETTIHKEFPPEVSPPSEMNDFDIKTITNRVFHTASAGDYLKIEVMAYDIDSDTSMVDFYSLAEAFGIPYASELRQYYESLPEDIEFIGYYENIWYAEENWGIGQYSEEGIDDLMLWFSVYSHIEPSIPSKPILLPDIKIQKVDIPSEIKHRTGQFFYDTWSFDVTLINNEDFDITVELRRFDSDMEQYSSHDVTVPSNSTKYYEMDLWTWNTGVLSVSCSIYYNGDEIDSWAGSVNVI